VQNRFADSPDIYKQFLEILQTYQRESKPIQDVYAQVTLLFNTAPDLLEDFKQFLPESAAQAKSQAISARQTTEDASVVSNVRGEPNYSSSSALAQAQSSRSDVKMPPLGQFNVKDSTKESKKRRGGPGAQGALGSAPAGPSPSTVDSANISGNQVNRAPGVPIANVNKVSEYFSYYCRKNARAHGSNLRVYFAIFFQDIDVPIHITLFPCVLSLSSSDVFLPCSHLALLLPISKFFCFYFHSSVLPRPRASRSIFPALLLRSTHHYHAISRKSVGWIGLKSAQLRR
jgi:hypothetical protein